MSLPAAFFSVVLIWSTTPLAIKWSSLGIGFSFAVFARMAISVLLCIALLALFRIRFPLHRKARMAYVAGGVSMFATMALTYWSAQYVSSGMIAVLFGLSPLITSLGAMLWLEEESLSRNKIADMLLGVLCLLMVFYGGLDLGSNAGIGIVTLLCAVTAQSLGLVWIKRIGDDSPPLAMTCSTLAVSLPLFLLLGHALNNEAILPQVWLGMAGIVLGLGLHQWGGRRVIAG